ncbi:MAG: hypothetical protein M1826_007605 [Phylliscum demangeonii]|nr:MAG: hypothetical protein M1826_007605 [Phylliscum demangeonii]
MATTTTPKQPPPLSSSSGPEKLVLYTNHGCPWAHRVHIALSELGVPYQEVIIDLETPREEWYLKINPRGQVPVLRYGEHGAIVRESGIIPYFLADSHHPNGLLPAPTASHDGGNEAALTAAGTRARIAFFVDAWFAKVQPLLYAGMQLSPDAADAEAAGVAHATELAAAVQTEIEPLLADAAPFFAGSKELTMAEVLTASWVVRLYAFARADIFAPALLPKLDALPHFAKWARACEGRKSVTGTGVWSEEKSVAVGHRMMNKMKGKKV